jgi:hypothetical protein
MTWHVTMMLVTKKGVCPTVFCGEKQLEERLLSTVRKRHFFLYDLSARKESEESAVTYRVNDKAYTFFIPGAQQPARWAFFSCNGYHSPEKRESIGGIQPMWRHLLSERPHLLFPGGDQLYSEEDNGDPIHSNAPQYSRYGIFAVPLVQAWLQLETQEAQQTAPFTEEMRSQVRSFYMRHYLRQMTRPVYSDALASIPGAPMWDDHEIFDGFGSHPDYMQTSPVFQGIFQCALEMFLLFQLMTTRQYAKEDGFIGKEGFSYMRHFDQGRMAMLILDARSERSSTQILSQESWDAIFQKLETLPEGCRHLVVIAGVPVVFPDATKVNTLIENAQELPGLKQMLSLFPLFKSQFGRWPLSDDGLDQWGHPNHVDERNQLIEHLQALAESKKVRISFFGGDVHMCGAGKLEGATKQQHIWQVISSPIGNVPAPHVIAEFLQKVNIVQHGTHGLRTQLIPLKKKWLRAGETLIAKRNFVTVQREGEDLAVTYHVEQQAGSEEAPKRYRLKIPYVV